MNLSVVIPALNEEEPIAAVVRDCLATGLPGEVIVVDNGSTDRTAEHARAAGYDATITGSGAQILGVVKSSPAAKVLEVGDTITAVDNSPVATASAPMPTVEMIRGDKRSSEVIK